MGAAEVRAFEEVRASKQWDALRGQLHTRFAPWRDGVEAQLPEPAPTLAQGTETVWHLRQELPGGLPETLVAHAHRGASIRQQPRCPQGDRVLQARAPVSRTVATMGGTVQMERPDFYGRPCRGGGSPLEAALGLTPGRTQRDGHQAAVHLVTAVPSDAAPTLCGALTGVGWGSARRPTGTPHIAEGLPVLEVLPPRHAITQRSAAVAAGRSRRPVLGLGLAGASGPPRPDRARTPCAGHRRQRAKRARGRGQGRDA